MQAYLSIALCFAGICGTMYVASDGVRSFVMPGEIFRTEIHSGHVNVTVGHHHHQHNTTVTTINYWPAMGEFLYVPCCGRVWDERGGHVGSP